MIVSFYIRRNLPTKNSYVVLRLKFMKNGYIRYVIYVTNSNNSRNVDLLSYFE